MRYYVAADIHGFYTLFYQALDEAGYFRDPQPHKLLILGDLFDRGEEAVEMQQFLLRLLEKQAVILVRGNHEDLFEDLVTVDRGRPLWHHRANGTFDTARQLTGFSLERAILHNRAFAEAAQDTPFYRQIIPSTLDYYETERYVFVHGWIPGTQAMGEAYRYDPGWRYASPELWRRARWTNGIDAAPLSHEEKTVVCGHFHCSYGHAVYEGRGQEFGPDADFSPYYGPGVIALDACTAYSGRINLLVFED